MTVIYLTVIIPLCPNLINKFFIENKGDKIKDWGELLDRTDGIIIPILIFIGSFFIFLSYYTIITIISLPIIWFITKPIRLLFKKILK
jgi:hypothetical protein